MQSRRFSTGCRWRRSPGWLNLVVVLVLGMLAPLTGIRLALRATLILSVVLAAAFLAAAQLAFNAGWVISFV
jgi:hypothetical protein